MSAIVRDVEEALTRERFAPAAPADAVAETKQAGKRRGGNRKQSDKHAAA
jgi:hypothetical protein